MRIDVTYLLKHGWHGFWKARRTWWSHPDYCTKLVTFREAVNIEKTKRTEKAE